MTEPLISLLVSGVKRTHRPGEEVEFEYQIDAVEAEEIQAVEASVLWRTEGKGDEDIEVHYFERRAPADVENGDLRPLRRFRTHLPNSPLSYAGEIVKIAWCVRVRVFLRSGKQALCELPLQVASANEGE